MAVDIAQIPVRHEPGRTGSIRGILRNYPDATNIISEFIQNAEDARFGKIQFEVSEDHVLITNDGDAFSNKDYERLVIFAQGKWGEAEKIGKFGVGFISAYHLTDSPTIVSNGVKLVIEPDGRISKRKHTGSDGKRGSTFILPLRRRPTGLSEQIGVKEVTDERVKSFVDSFKEKFYRCVLFLGGERTIEGWERSGKNRRLVCRCRREVLLRQDRLSPESGVIVYEKVLIHTEWPDIKSGKMASADNEWLVFSQDFEKEYVHTKEYVYTRGAKPPGRTKVSLAFKLRDRNSDEVGYLHAFLPTKIKTGLLFNLNADFAPRTGRDDIIEGESAEASWNELLIDCLGRLSVSIVDQLKSEVDTPADFYEIIPVDCAEDRPYLRRVVRTFVDGVRDKAIVFSSKHGWSTRHEAYRVNAELRKIVKGSGKRFVAPEIQDNRRAARLFDEIEVEWFNSEHLVSLLGQIPFRCRLNKAPRFIRSERSIGAIYRYLSKNAYDDMWDDLKGVSLCLDQSDVLHPFNSPEDRVYSADPEMRRILAGSEVRLVKKSLWKSHKRFLDKLVERFDMDHLITYLDKMKDECAGKKLHQSPTPILTSVAKVDRIYKYFKKHKVFEKSDWRDPLEGTALCVTENDTIHAFDRVNPPAFRAPREIRTILSRSKVNFVKEELQRHKDFLAQAGVPEFGVANMLLFLRENTADGVQLQKAARSLNTKRKLIRVYRYLKQARLDQGQLDTLKTIPIFLTSKGNLRPLEGSDQGRLQLSSGRISDPLELDNLLDDLLRKDRQLKKWLRDRLDVQEMTLERYVSDHLVPRYASAANATKLELLRILRGNLAAIGRNQNLHEALKSAELIQCQDGNYRCGRKVCFKSRSIDAAFDDDYYYPNRVYALSGKRKNGTGKDEWTDLFKELGVRRIPDPESVVRAANTLEDSPPTDADVKRACRLLRFLNNHWQEYKKEQEELEELQYRDWLPAKGDQKKLYPADSLHIPELEPLVATHATFVALAGMDQDLARFLGVHKEAQTEDIVSHLLALSETGRPASLAIYEELDRRRDGPAVGCLRHEDVVDVTGKGDFWNPDRLFFGECSADFGKYRRRLADRFIAFGWLFREIGVRYAPETKDYVDLLLEISDNFRGDRLPTHEASLVLRAYSRLASDLENVDDEEWNSLMRHRVVLGTDNILYEPSQVLIEDYPEYMELELREDPIFCRAEGPAEQFIKQLGVQRLSKALQPRLVSVEHERLDEKQTQLIREVWLEPLLTVNFTLLNAGRDLVSDRRILGNMEIHVAQRILVQWYCPKGGQEIPGAVREERAFYSSPILYVTDGDEESRKVHMAQELARVLAPDADPRVLALHYEHVLSRCTPDSISAFIRQHKYRSLPTDLTFPEGVEAGQPPEEPTEEPKEAPRVPVSGAEPGPKAPKVPGARGPKPVEYVDTSRLAPVAEGPATPNEARPFCIGATAAKRMGYVTRTGAGGDGGFSDENKETESLAFQLIRKYEGARGWHTDDNRGKGFKGYDIRARRGSEVKYIEVKSSRGWNCPDLSLPQLQWAKRKREKYYLYRVFNLERSDDDPVLYMIRDPWGYLETEVTGITVTGYKGNPKGDIKKVVFHET